MITFPSHTEERQMQIGQNQPAEDTAGSEIATREYPEEQMTIMAVGDSLTYGIRSPIGGYPAILQDMLDQAGYNTVVINAGIPGLTAPEADENFLETIAGGDIVLLMIGTNDICNPGGCPIPFECDTLEHTGKMLDKALISKITPLVSTVTPAYSEGDFAWANIYITSHNNMISQLAEKTGVLVVDNHTAIWANGGDILFEDKKVHFTDEGYEVIAQQWFDALVKNGLLEKDDE